jgi:hypothetical protein
MKRIIGTYIILVAISGIVLILSFIWLVYNISDSMAGLKPLLSYVFGINIYIFATLLVVGVLGAIINILIKYSNKKKI